MDKKKQAKAMLEMIQTADGVRLDRDTAAALDESEDLDVNHASGFVDDCEEAFSLIQKMQHSLDKMVDWKCVFGKEDAPYFRAFRKKLGELDARIYRTYKYADK